MSRYRWTRSIGSTSVAISTFALLLEAQNRGHPLSYYTPDRLALGDGKVFASVRALDVRDIAGDHFTLGEPRVEDLSPFDVVLLRQDPPFDLAYMTTTHCSSASIPRRWWSTTRRMCATRRRRSCHRISRPDAADVGHPRPRRDQGVPRRARRHRDEAALRPWRRGCFPCCARRSQFRLALRSVLGHLPRAMGGAKILARREEGRQAHHAGGRRVRRRGQPHPGSRRSALQHGARRHADGDRPDRRASAKSSTASARRCASAASCSPAST